MNFIRGRQQQRDMLLDEFREHFFSDHKFVTNDDTEQARKVLTALLPSGSASGDPRVAGVVYVQRSALQCGFALASCAPVFVSLTYLNTIDFGHTRILVARLPSNHGTLWFVSPLRSH